MIPSAKLLCDLDAEGDGLRYDAADESGKPQITEDKQRRPVVVWNLTKQCNLYCTHCYASADTETAPGELSTREENPPRRPGRLRRARRLFSGGEPLVRDDLEELIAYAADRGLRPVLSTNAGRCSPRSAPRRSATPVSRYAGVSVDGLPERNDEFRGKEGAFDAAVRGIEHCLDAGLKTGLRYTITEHNAADLEGSSTC